MEKVRFGIGIALAGGAVVGAIATIAITGEERYIGLLYLALFGLLAWPLQAGKEWAPGVMVVTAEEERAEQAERRGMTVRIRDCVREHPLIALVSTFTLGLLSNVVANLITG